MVQSAALAIRPTAGFASQVCQTPLLLAAAKGYEAVVKLLLGTGKVDADVKDNDGRTPLWWAVVTEHDAIVKLLLGTGKADVNAKDNRGRTLLSLAAKYRGFGIQKRAPLHLC